MTPDARKSDRCAHALVGVLAALLFVLTGQGTSRAADVPAVGTILTNSVRQADGSLVTKRYRVTTGVLHRDTQVSAVDPEKRKFPASVNAYGTGTYITDLPNKVIVVAQEGILRVFGNPDPSRTDGWPSELTHIYSQVSSLSEFLEFGSKSFVPPETQSFQVVPAPITHHGVHITRRPDLNAEDFYSVSIDYLSGIVAETVGDKWGQYIVTDGTNVVVSGSIPASASGFGGQVLGSSFPASAFAHGVILAPDGAGFVENARPYLERPMHNACWGAEFIGVEELTDTVPTVTLTGRMLASGFEVSFSPVVPAAAQLESSATLPGTWSPVQDVPAGAASAVIETAKLPSAPAFFRLSAKP